MSNWAVSSLEKAIKELEEDMRDSVMYVSTTIAIIKEINLLRGQIEKLKGERE